MNRFLSALLRIVGTVGLLTLGCDSPTRLPDVAYAFQSCSGAVHVVGGPARDTIIVAQTDCGGQVEQPVSAGRR